jgi:hypothetical protein
MANIGNAIGGYNISPESTGFAPMSWYGPANWRARYGDDPLSQR